ncbi:Protein sgm1 [Ceratocystis fimbriata CBS 114723]|uniref:Protein sgm1 n=1 Tax=Ceratocystis fimbriata CBS 114723 TaxID=1035309 RepID=A0A2C5XDR3_9PEZI|nr:Protein sgm1 [Ceratocystis fimbriata CBS 114723]
MGSAGKASGWGSFLQQAVAGVEARLDNILADEQGFASTSTLPAIQTTTPTPPTTTEVATKPIPEPSQQPSSNKQPNKLQERLAKAIAAKASPRTSTSIDLSDTSTTLNVPDPPHKELDGNLATLKPSDPLLDVSTPNEPLLSVEEDIYATSTSDNSKTLHGNRAAETCETSRPRPLETTAADEGKNPTTSLASEKKLTSQPKSDYHECQHQELNDYLERIDNMAAKIRFLTDDVLKNSLKSKNDTSPNGIERQLAERDTQIAQLIREGQDLSLENQKCRTAIKNLKAKLLDQSRDMEVTKAKLENSTAQLSSLQIALDTNNGLEKDLKKAQIFISRLQSESSKLNFELQTKDATIQSLNMEIQTLLDVRDAPVVDKHPHQSDADMLLNKELQDTIASMKIEKSLVTERANKQLSDLKIQLDAAAERCRKVEAEREKEVQALEGKLEAARVYAEEVSSLSTGDSNTKLLRQVETLQTQYAIANENWQGIESSLLARLAGLERERDDAFQRESDMRKKVRESTLRLKRQEEEVTELRSKLDNSDDESPESKAISACMAENETLKNQLKEKEESFKQLQLEMMQKQEEWKANFDRNPSEKWQTIDEIAGINMRSATPLRPDSPQLSYRSQLSNVDLLSTSNIKTRKTSAPGAPCADPDRPSSRWGAPQWALASQALSTSARSNSVISSKIESPMDRPSSPSISFSESMENFGQVDTPSSPQNPTNDMVSVSTVAAGPSIQLVDRLSATVRRLEAERVASKEEKDRIAHQRDEARAEISALMKRIQTAQASESRISELEVEIKEVNARYQTTLEMLGEKSELVEELKADVQDVKAMYRDLVESTVGK